MKTNEKKAGLALPEILRQTAKKYPSATAISFMGKKTDYRTFDRLSDNVAAALAARGIVKGDHVGLYCVNSDMFAVTYFGIIKAGAVVIPVNILLNPREIEYILNDAGAKVLFYYEAFKEAVVQIETELRRFECCIMVGEGQPPQGHLAMKDFCAFDAEPPRIDFNPADDLAAILYTAGTTGHPKGAMLTHRNLACNSDSICAAINFEAEHDVVLVVLPMFHAFAATVGMLAPLLHGGTVVPLVRFEPETIANTIESEAVTVFPAVPSMYNVLLRLPDKYVSKFSTLKQCFSGGAAMPLEIMRKFEARFGCPICEGDGPTECSPVTCVNPIEGVRKPGSVGPVVKDVEMCIMDEQAKELPLGEVGEICVRGPSVMKGYWKNPEATRQAFFGKWFRTGDLGTEDKDGYFFIVDRKKDLIIVNGMNVYPRIIEEVLYRHPAIHEAAVIGEQHKLHGEIPVAYVALKPGAQANDREIKLFCREFLGRYEVPRQVFFMPALPKNAAGKIMKRELRKQGELERGVDGRPADKAN